MLSKYIFEVFVHGFTLGNTCSHLLQSSYFHAFIIEIGIDRFYGDDAMLML